MRMIFFYLQSVKNMYFSNGECLSDAVVHIGLYLFPISITVQTPGTKIAEEKYLRFDGSLKVTKKAGQLL